MMLYAMIGPRRKGFQDRWKDGLGFLLLLVVSPGQAHRSFHLYSMEEMMMMVIERQGLIIWTCLINHRSSVSSFFHYQDYFSPIIYLAAPA